MEGITLVSEYKDQEKSTKDGDGNQASVMDSLKSSLTIYKSTAVLCGFDAPHGLIAKAMGPVSVQVGVCHH